MLSLLLENSGKKRTMGFNGRTSLPLVPYFAPGAPDFAHVVRALASSHHAVLLTNHDPVVAGISHANAQYAAEELEESAALFLMLQNQALRLPTPEQIAGLRRRPNRS